MIRLLIPDQISGDDRRLALAKAIREVHACRLQRKSEARLGRLLKYHQAKRAERAAMERMRAWQSVQIPDVVA